MNDRVECVGELMMRQNGEPSVEEILESIKKVIARDTHAQMAASAVHFTPAPSAVPIPEPLIVQNEDVLDLYEAALLEDFEMVPSSDTPKADEPLVNEGARTSMRESLAALAMLSEPSVPPQIVRSGETSLEGLTRDLLRPMLAEWLDTHLPAIVERMVSAEITRIVGKRG